MTHPNQDASTPPPESVVVPREDNLQERVRAWTRECFGDEISCDVLERMDRFIEEALELNQSLGYTPDRAHALVDYVFQRPAGQPSQEVGGTSTTLAALCNAIGVNVEEAYRAEVDRITQPDIILKIRAKQAAKPHGSALPVAAPVSPPAPDARSDGLREALWPFSRMAEDSEWDDVPDDGEVHVTYRSEAGGEESVAVLTFADLRRARAAIRTGAPS